MKQQGFTLIELIIASTIALSITGIAGQGMTSTKYWLEPTRLLSAIQETRSLSIIHNQHAVLCPSEDNVNCIKDWQLPLIIFIDSNNNKKRDFNENLIQSIKPYSNIERTIEYPRSRIRFNGQGQINGYTGTLKYCSKYNSKGIVLSRVGRIRYIHDLSSSSTHKQKCTSS